MLTEEIVPFRASGIKERNASDDHLLLLHGKSGYLLNSSAGKIWQLCDGRRSILEISNKLEQQFDLPKGSLLPDVNCLIQKLLKEYFLSTQNMTHNRSVGRKITKRQGVAIRIVVYLPRGCPRHHVMWGTAFFDGLRRHGLPVQLRRKADAVPADLAVMWSHRESPTHAAQRAAAGRYLVMERGYFADRFEWTSFGYDGLNGRADFCNTRSPGDRWKPHEHLMRPWRNDGNYVLVIGQVSGDAAVHHVSLCRWYASVIREVRALGLDVAFRPHPFAKESQSVDALVMAGNLETALTSARAVVTFNSNVGVDATPAGVPTVTMDEGAMAWPVTAHTFQALLDPPRPDRMQWAYDLAYAQWQLTEVESGELWEHLKVGIPI